MTCEQDGMLHCGVPMYVVMKYINIDMIVDPRSAVRSVGIWSRGVAFPTVRCRAVWCNVVKLRPFERKHRKSSPCLARKKNSKIRNDLSPFTDTRPSKRRMRSLL